MLTAERRDQPIITLTNPVPTEGGRFNGKITYDVYTRSKTPSASLAAIDGVLRGVGFTNVFTEDSRFYTQYGKSAPEDISRIFQSDIVGISGTNRTADSSLDLAREYKQQNPKGKIIAGGFGPTMEPEKWLCGGVDIVIRGEGDVTGPLVVKALINGTPLENIQGISYIIDGELRHNEDASLLTERELSEVPLPFYPNYIKKRRSVHVVNESRGCYGKCRFCCVTMAYKGTYRMKAPERVAAEIKDSRDGESVFFVGDNLAPRSRRADSKLLAETLIANGLKRPYLAQVDASFAEDMNLVRIWKKAGLFYAFKGFESTNPEALGNVSKAFTVEQNTSSTKILRDEGYMVHDMFILAVPGDTPETMKTLKAYIKNGNLASTGQFFLLTPLAGTKLGKEQKVFDFAQKESNLFDGQHLVTLPPPEFTCVGIQDASINLYLDFFSTNHLLRTLVKDSKQLFSDPRRALRLLAFDLVAHGYARKTALAMKKDPYYQEFREKLKEIDSKRETVIFEAGKK